MPTLLLFPPYSLMFRVLILDDIATLTGGTVFDKDKGMKLDKFNWEWFGEAKTVTVTKEQTTIIV